jgi:cytochrome c oxidase assembly protein subunit 15
VPRLSLTPRAYARITFAALVALAAIIVTGAAVRLTGSGLGCPEWPTCGGGRVVAPLEYHAMVEFVNRVVTGVVSVAVIVAVLGALARVPRRRDLTLLALGLVAGVAGQVVLGGLVVLSHLWPPLVMGHFALSIVLLTNATVLHHRASQPDDAEPALCVSGEHLMLARLLLAAAAVVLLLGTLVTGSGPHAGSHDGELIERLPFDVGAVARLHGVSVIVFLVITIATAVLLRRDGAPADVMQRVTTLLVVLCAQAAVGYTQYFTGVPPLLVGIHIAGAVAVWWATLRLLLSMRVPATKRVAVAA